MNTLSNRQRGVSLIGFLIIAALLGVVALSAAKVIPSYNEYRAILKAVKKAKNENPEPSGIRRAFDLIAAIDYIDSITGRDLVITKEDSGLVVSFAYPKKIPMFNHVFLLIEYQGSSKDE